MPLVAAALALGSCVSDPVAPERSDARDDTTLDEDEAMTPPGRLTARPHRRAGGSVRHGLSQLGLAKRRDALLYVPQSYDPQTPAPLAIMLHGAGSCAERGLRPFIPHAENLGLILLAPPSRGRTWDVILSGFGPDVSFIDEALEHVFSRYAVNPDRIAIEGFSDGASYALSLGLTNGNLFSHVIAFSPGFMRPGTPSGRPRIFLSHGVDDGVLPIDQTSRRLVPVLKQGRYAVTYREFDGRHLAAPRIAREALEWWLGGDVGAGDPTETTGDQPC